jgi:hyaluronan synthase
MQVFPDAHRVYFAEPLGEIGESAAFVERDGSSADAVYDILRTRHLASIQNTILEQIRPSDLKLWPCICVSQPHLCKKDIQFTSLLVSIALAEIKGYNFIWGSDSDSVFQKDAIPITIDLLAKSPKNGGASARMREFQKNATPVSKMVAAKYWLDQDVTRMQTAAFNSSECQPGPCSALRVEALKQVIMPWYLQRLWGHKMVRAHISPPFRAVISNLQVKNEDRHLTANLLHKGWNVQYAARALVLTETPNRSIAWIRQQVRWSRGTHLERISSPMLYAQQHPWFTWQVWQEQVLPFIACVASSSSSFVAR